MILTIKGDVAVKAKTNVTRAFTMAFVMVSLLMYPINNSKAQEAESLEPNKTFLREIYLNTKSSLKTMPYRMYVPNDYDATKDYPIVLYLHGAGERGNDNEKHLVNNSDILKKLISEKYRQDYPCVILAPQCAEDQQWVNVPWNKASYSVDGMGISVFENMALDLLEKTMTEYNINRKKVYVIGISMGGYGTWDAISRRPDLFAAAIPVCGGGDPSKAKEISNTAVWTFHSADDTLVPVAGTRDMVEALKAIKADIKFDEYETGGHGAWGPAFTNDELIPWLFSKSKKTIKISNEPSKVNNQNQRHYCHHDTFNQNK